MKYTTDCYELVAYFFRETNSNEQIINECNKLQEEVKMVFVPLLTKPILYDSAKQANFFTLSSFGVTQFINGKPEFSELEQWKREVRLSTFEKFRISCMADCT